MHMFERPRSRREMLKLGVFAGTALAGFTTANRQPSTARSSLLTDSVSAGAPGPGSFQGGKHGGEVTTVWTSSPETFDPALGWNPQAWEAITQLIFTPLLQFEGQNGLPAPSAAAEMPTFSDDDLRVTIKLRDDVRFHNGRPVIADDYVYAWTRVLEPEVASWASSYLLGIEGAEAVYEGESAEISGVQVIDDHTLEVALVAPDITFLSLLCQPYMAALPEEEIEALGAYQFGRTPVGNGPFVAASWDDKLRTAKFERNLDYFWEGTPFLEEVTYRWGITSELQLLQVQGGAVELAGDEVAPNQAALLLSQGAEGEQFTHLTPILAVYWIAMNLTKGVLKDVRVRQALNYATDRDQLARASFGIIEAGSVAFPAELPEYNRIAQGYEYDPDKAKKLLKQAGRERIQLEFLHGGSGLWPAAAQILQQQWEAVGVELTLTAMGSAALTEAEYNQLGDVYGTRKYMVQPSALDIVLPCWVTDQPFNTTGYSNSEVDELASQARSASSMAESNVYIAEIERILEEDAAGIFTGSVNFISARSPDLQNFQYRGENGIYYDRLWLDEEHGT